ncbi:hypothetical protein LTR20_008585 [Exophiala xenobiotica]|nr:hypothetical protein LTR79_003043 [Exophiala xenobiotica]KAK5457839.1 hypothetical protein LTR20_008585 [Exophiala xenobiotica]KAK5490810.1 hypothetical protein LTR26_003570 [Exophiala xenobiotica]KAK5510056.1 hypothetical protein LTR07_010240 [Exophiala xenobiotica]
MCVPMYGSVHRDSVLESAERIAHEQRMAYYPPPAPPYMQPYPGYMPYYAPQQQFDQMQLGGRPQASPGYPAGSERAPQMPAYGHPQPPPPVASAYLPPRLDSAGLEEDGASMLDKVQACKIKPRREVLQDVAKELCKPSDHHTSQPPQDQVKHPHLLELFQLSQGAELAQRHGRLASAPPS